jgi:HSP20 family protein
MAEKTRIAIRRRDGALRRLDPFEVLSALQDEMDRYWRDPFRLASLAFPFGRLTRSAADFTPRIDAYEQDHTIVVTAELPGLKKDDVQVELDDDGLVIRGQSQAEREVKEDAYYRAERSFGSFYRRLPLPFEVQPEQIQASMTDGVLEVRIPRPVQSQTDPKKIPVTSADSASEASHDSPSNNGSSDMEAGSSMEVPPNG